MELLSTVIDYRTYKIIHIVGIMLTFMGFAYGMKQWTKGAAIAHGIGLALLLISGMAMVGKNFAPWVFVKIAIWLALGGSIVLVKRKVVPPFIAWVIVLVLGTVAAWTALYGRGLFVSI